MCLEAGSNCCLLLRYDEWVKADRIIWPVEKGTKKRRRKKVKVSSCDVTSCGRGEVTDRCSGTSDITSFRATCLTVCPPAEQRGCRARGAPLPASRSQASWGEEGPSSDQDPPHSRTQRLRHSQQRGADQWEDGGDALQPQRRQ